MKDYKCVFVQGTDTVGSGVASCLLALAHYQHIQVTLLVVQYLYKWYYSINYTFIYLIVVLKNGRYKNM